MDKKDWISLKERYPDMTEISCSAYSRHYKSEKVLVYTKNNNYFIAECKKYEDFTGPDTYIWYSYGTGGRRMVVKNKVIAWMPLPKKHDGE